MKSAFLVTDEQPIQEQQTPQTSTQSQNRPYKAVAQVTAPPTATPTPAPITEGLTLELDYELMDKLCDRLESENIPGPDYMELRTAVNDEKLQGMIPDLKTRFMVAFSTLSATSPNLTKAHVLESIDTYIKLLKKWEQEAIAEINAQRDSIKDTAATIEAKRQQMAALAAEITSMEESVNATYSKCTANESKMSNAVNYLINQISNDRSMIDAGIN